MQSLSKSRRIVLGKAGNESENKQEREHASDDGERRICKAAQAAAAANVRPNPELRPMDFHFPICLFPAYHRTAPSEAAGRKPGTRQLLRMVVGNSVDLSVFSSQQ